VRVPAPQRHFDERNFALDQAASQQAALTEAMASIAIAECGWFLIEIKRAGGFGLHQSASLLVGCAVSDRSQSGMRLREVLRQFG
jgi:hypothetical protein